MDKYGNQYINIRTKSIFVAILKNSHFEKQEKLGIHCYNSTVLKQHRILRKLHLLLGTILVLFLAACTVGNSQISSFPTSENVQATEEIATVQPTETAVVIEPTMEQTANDNGTAEEIVIQHLMMVDGEHGWGMDVENRLLVTQDGGSSWQDITPSLGEFEWSGFFALDMENAWLVPTQEDCTTATCSAYQIWRTSDGGATWKAGQPLCTGDHCSEHNSTQVDFAKPVQIQFLDEANGWLLLNINHVVDMDHYRIYRTNDGGENWQFIIDHNNGPQTYRVTGLSFLDNNFGWLTTSDLINTENPSPNWFVYRTYDAGATWSRYQIPEPHHLPEAFSTYDYSCGIEDLEILPPKMLDMKMKCVVFAEEEIEYTFHYHSLTAGKNWSRWQIIENVDFVSLVSGWQIQPNGDGYVLQNTRDGGANWLSVAEVPWRGELTFANDSSGYALVHDEESNHLYQTMDGGNTWHVVDTLLTDEPILQLADSGMREFFLSGQNGQTFPVVYYPPSTTSAPAIILMHQVNMDLYQWDAIARWLWKGDVSEYQDDEHPWLDSSWFPENTLEERPAVFVFTYRDCNNGCSEPEVNKVLNDAQTVINYAINQPEIDSSRITVVGTSVSADAAIDACFLMHKNDGFDCQNVVSLSPGSYLDLEYGSVVKEMMKTDTNIYCYASRSDSESAVLCMDNSPTDTYDYFVGKGLQHGVELFAPDYEVNMLEKLIELISE